MEELVKALEQIRDGSFNGAGTLAVTYQWQTFAIELQGIADAALRKLLSQQLGETQISS